MSTWLRRGFTLVVVVLAVGWSVKVIRGRGETEQWARILARGERDDRLVALGELGLAPPAKMGVVVPALLEATRDGDADVRALATSVLGTLLRSETTGPAARAAATGEAIGEALRRLLGDSSPEVQSTAASMLDTGEPVDPEVIDALARASRSPNAAVASAAIAGLGRLRSHPELVRPALLEAMQSDDPYTRLAASTAAGERWGDEPEFFGAILGTVVDDRFELQRSALLAVMARVGRPPAEAVPGLRRALGHPDPSVRTQAVDALGRIGPPALAAREEVLALVDDPEVPVDAAVRALVRIDGGAGPAVEGLLPVLVERLGRAGPGEAAGPARALAELGPASAPAAPEILAALRRAQPRPPEEMLWSGSAMPGPVMFGPSTFSPVAPSTHQGTGFPEPRGGRGRLISYANRDRLELARTLARVAPGSPEASEAVMLLAGELEAPEAWGGWELSVALGEFGPAAAPAAPALLRALRRQVPGRFFAASALASAAPGSPQAAEAVSLLLAELADLGIPPIDLVEALGAFGPAAAPALPTLRALAGASDIPDLRLAAERAAARVSGEPAP